MRKMPKKSQYGLLITILISIVSGCVQNEEKSSSEIPVVYPEVIRVFPHDTTAFTQGLIWRDNYLYESTGLYGNSSLRKIDPETGNVLKIKKIDSVFAEGLCWWEGKLVQLTWKENKAFIYDYPSMRIDSHFTYAGEGWGLTRYNGMFVMSNGSANLVLRNELFKAQDSIKVTYNGKPLSQINELETVLGKIYANVWFSDMIFEIDPTSGQVTRVVDCRQLVENAGISDPQSVLNGIAWRKETQTFFITGKRWPVMYEIKIPKT